MLYWLSMGALLLGMLMLMKVGSKKGMSIIKPVMLMALIVFLFLSQSLLAASHLWALLGLGLYILCYCIDEFAPKHKTLQLAFFSAACLCYSLSFWVQVETLSWVVPIALFALIVVGFLILLPLLDTFVLKASLVAIILWQLLWAAGEVFRYHEIWLNFSGYLGALLLAISVLIWAIHYFKQPFKYSYVWTMSVYFSAHILIIAPLALK
ncbi:MAG: lysoplasmalogenase family protein [Vibrio sp.]